jgi:hypothetical protein
MEKTDMWLNLSSLVLNLLIAFLGLTFFKNLSVVNYAIFISFLFFHVAQDIILVKKGISKQSESLFFYVLSAFLLMAYHFIAPYFSSYYFFFLFWLFFGTCILIYRKTFIRPVSVTG